LSEFVEDPSTAVAAGSLCGMNKNKEDIYIFSPLFAITAV
jgi:hypothetical protein